MNPMGRLRYRSGVVSLARFLHLTGVLKGLYFHLTAPSDRILRVKTCGIETLFYVRTPLEWWRTEGVSKGDESEGLSVGDEEDFLGALISALRPGDVFYDVGSSIGLFAIALSRVVGAEGQVIGFEPATQAYERLRDHLQLNEVSNVRVFRQALGAQNSGGRLFVGGDVCASLVLNSGYSKQQSASEDVEIVQGDWLRENEHLPVPRAIKIDVEGYEYSVLQGLQRTLADPQCQLLCIEVHPGLLPPEVKPQAITALIGSLGFDYINSVCRGNQVHVIASKGAAQNAPA